MVKSKILIVRFCVTRKMFLLKNHWYTYEISHLVVFCLLLSVVLFRCEQGGPLTSVSHAYKHMYISCSPHVYHMWYHMSGTCALSDKHTAPIFCFPMSNLFFLIWSLLCTCMRSITGTFSTAISVSARL